MRSGNIQTSYVLAIMLLMLAPSRARPPISSHPITYNPPALGNNRYPIAILLKLILYFILKCWICIRVKSHPCSDSISNAFRKSYLLPTSVVWSSLPLQLEETPPLPTLCSPFHCRGSFTPASERAHSHTLLVTIHLKRISYWFGKR